MAVGDAFVGVPTSATSGTYVDIKPASSAQECVVHCIFWEDDVELYWSDGSNNIKFDSDTAYGGRLATPIRITYGAYVRVKNAATATQYIGYTGVITKDS